MLQRKHSGAGNQLPDWTKLPPAYRLARRVRPGYRLADLKPGCPVMSFIPDATVLIQFAIASVILAITPGPDMTLFVSRTL